MADDLADDLTASDERFDAQADDQAEAFGASFVPLPDEQAVSYELADNLGSDLADAIGAGCRPSADDQAEAFGANFVPLSDDQAVSYEAPDDQAEIAGPGNGS